MRYLIAAMVGASAMWTYAMAQGVVTSATPEATQAGLEILQNGGNAVDAAIAVSLALGVTEPAGSGIGGQTVMLIAKPGETPKVIHGTSLAPAATPEKPAREALRSGYTATTVPSTLKVLDKAYREFGGGTVEWRDLVSPAIRYAQDGFIVGGFRARSFSHYKEGLAANPVTAKMLLREDGQSYQEGDRVKRPTLARTLTRIAREGAEDFYNGQIASQIAEDMQDNGGWLSLADLNNFPEPPIAEPLHTTYRGHDVYTLPPPFGGWVMLHALQSLNALPPETLNEANADRAVALIDALHGAHKERRSNPVPDWRNAESAIQERLGRGETTHFTVIDKDGMIASVTQSIDGYFGAKAASPKLGFLYNNYMNSLDDEGPYGAGPGKAPLSSMSATIVYKDGDPVLALGSPGSARIISAVAQVTSYWIDVEQNIDAGVSGFRVHALPENRAYVEDPEVPNELLLALAAKGYDLRRPFFGVARGSLDPYFGGVHAVAFENGEWTGAADPRRDGTVAVHRD